MVAVMSNFTISIIYLAMLALSLGQLKQMNLVFIMFDDLRPELTVYDRKHMITPNFERLAHRSVVFDYAFCQVAVCNPSRDSLLTGLRPDTVGTYNFQHSFGQHFTFPALLVKSGYNTAGYGKIIHWDGPDKRQWSFDSWENKWYDFQALENSWMNSSTMPDKTRKEEQFRDHEFATRAIHNLRKLADANKPFMLGIGFKLPHLAIHVPFKYYEMYKNKTHEWKMDRRELRYPVSSPDISYRCCADHQFRFMREEGGKKANRSVPIGDINMQWTNEMHDEMMLGYCAGVSFVDVQVGRMLDAMDELKLWENTVVVLTADHGMHNGEKGIWEKWTLFDEATRVPLFIAHPKSPYKGQHFSSPVELIDIYPTIIDLLQLPQSREKYCHGKIKCKELSGKSLAPMILGQEQYNKYIGKNKLKYPIVKTPNNNEVQLKEMKYEHDFAISQVIRCVSRDKLSVTDYNFTTYGNHTLPFSLFRPASSVKHGFERLRRKAIWGDCDTKRFNALLEVSVLGYSMRTSEYRYTVYFHWNIKKEIPEIDLPPMEYELYDHRNETLADFTHRELVNIAHRPQYHHIVESYHNRLVQFIRTIPFGNH